MSLRGNAWEKKPPAWPCTRPAIATRKGGASAARIDGLDTNNATSAAMATRFSMGTPGKIRKDHSTGAPQNLSAIDTRASSEVEFIRLGTGVPAAGEGFAALTGRSQ